MRTRTFALVHKDPWHAHTHTLQRDRWNTVSIPEAQEKRGGGEKERQGERGTRETDLSGPEQDLVHSHEPVFLSPDEMITRDLSDTPTHAYTHAHTYTHSDTLSHTHTRTQLEAPVVRTDSVCFAMFPRFVCEGERS